MVVIMRKFNNSEKLAGEDLYQKYLDEDGIEL